MCLHGLQCFNSSFGCLHGLQCLHGLHGLQCLHSFDNSFRCCLSVLTTLAVAGFAVFAGFCRIVCRFTVFAQFAVFAQCTLYYLHDYVTPM